MPSFTIHALDTELDRRLSDEAKRADKSKNRLIQELLAKAMGLSSGSSYADDYSEFCGLWTAEEHRSFTAAQVENNRIDPEDWRA